MASLRELAKPAPISNTQMQHGQTTSTEQLQVPVHGSNIEDIGDKCLKEDTAIMTSHGEFAKPAPISNIQTQHGQTTFTEQLRLPVHGSNVEDIGDKCLKEDTAIITSYGEFAKPAPISNIQTQHGQTTSTEQLRLPVHGSNVEDIGDKCLKEDATIMTSHGEFAKSAPISNIEMQHGQTTSIQQLQVPEHGSNVEEIVKNCWEEIESKCLKGDVQSNPETERKGWKVVRLFVSSTFQDFQSEREVLVKKVFPELKEWCLQHQLHLVECDLRWGIPKVTTTTEVLCICMDEIERCHGETDGQGMFLTLLGERYGWVPGVDDLPPHLVEQLQWVFNLSVTHMEVLLGALYRDNRNASFFIRDPTGWLDKLPAATQAYFIEQSELGRAQLKTLKSKLKENYPKRCFEYSCHVDDPDKITGTPSIKGLDDFGNNVLSFFKEAITREYPTVKGNDDKPAPRVEQFFHDCILEQKGAMVFGRDREYNLILRYAKGKISQEDLEKSWVEINPDVNEDEDGNSEEDEKENKKDVRSENIEGCRNIVAIVAEPGAGKSSLMAKCALEASKMELDAFVHFVGCSGISTYHVNIIKRLCLFLLPHGDSKKEEVFNMNDSNKLQKTLDTLLEERRQSGKQLLILIDDLSQLYRERGNLNWIPKTGLPENITLVTSMIKGDKVVDSLKERTDKITWLNLGYLTDQARHEIVTSYLKRYNKILDPEQTELVVKSEGAKNALWLTMACEELRVFGFFDILTKYIRELPSTLDGLLEKILVRIVSEDETSLVKQTLCFLECARDGLREAALQLLLGDLDEKKPVPLLHWAMVNRTLKPFVRVASNYQQLNQLTFYHQAIKKAVKKQWLLDKEIYVKHHRILANYFQNHCTDDRVVGREAAYHMNCGKDGTRLIHFIKNDNRARYIDTFTVSRYMKELRCKNFIFSPTMFTKQLYCCHPCSFQRQAFTKIQLHPNIDSCVLCGSFVDPGSKRPQNMAYWCDWCTRRPTGVRYFGNQECCYICNRFSPRGLGNPSPFGPFPLYLCHMCHLGGPIACCRVDG